MILLNFFLQGPWPRPYVHSQLSDNVTFAIFFATGTMFGFVLAVLLFRYLEKDKYIEKVQHHIYKDLEYVEKIEQEIEQLRQLEEYYKE